MVFVNFIKPKRAGDRAIAETTSDDVVAFYAHKLGLVSIALEIREGESK